GVLADWPTVSWRRQAWAVSADGRRLALGTSGGKVYQWDLRTRGRIRDDANFQQAVRLLDYSPDGRWLAVAGEESVVGLFDPITGRRAGPLLTQDGAVSGVAFTRDGRALLTVDGEGRCHRWDLGPAQAMEPAQWQTWLEAATGLRQGGDTLVALSVAEYQD